MVSETEESQLQKLENHRGGGGAWEYLSLVRDKVLKHGLTILNDPDDGEDEQWCEDGSSWNGSDGKFDPSCDLDREWHKRKNQFHAIGYRDGLIAGKEASAQEGFNVGFKESVVVGFNLGLVRGVTGALDCLPGELRKKIVESQENRNKFHDLYESVNKLSTTDASKVFHDGLTRRRVNQGVEEQNSDGCALDSYYGQLQSLIVECPAIEVQSRDKAIDV